MKAITKKQLINRLHRLSGQLQGLEKMLDQDKYCADIIMQSLAVQKGLQSFNQVMLDIHLREHAAEQFKKGQQNKAIKELLDIYFLNNK